MYYGGHNLRRFVYWYGTPRFNMSEAYSLVNPKQITSYEEGCRKGYDKVVWTMGSIPQIGIREIKAQSE